MRSWRIPTNVGMRSWSRSSTSARGPGGPGSGRGPCGRHAGRAGGRRVRAGRARRASPRSSVAMPHATECTEADTVKPCARSGAAMRTELVGLVQQARYLNQFRTRKRLRLAPLPGKSRTELVGAEECPTSSVRLTSSRPPQADATICCRSWVASPALGGSCRPSPPLGRIPRGRRGDLRNRVLPIVSETMSMTSMTRHTWPRPTIGKPCRGSCPSHAAAAAACASARSATWMYRGYMNRPASGSRRRRPAAASLAQGAEDHGDQVEHWCRPEPGWPLRPR